MTVYRFVATASSVYFIRLFLGLNYHCIAKARIHCEARFLHTIRLMLIKMYSNSALTVSCESSKVSGLSHEPIGIDSTVSVTGIASIIGS